MSESINKTYRIMFIDDIDCRLTLEDLSTSNSVENNGDLNVHTRTISVGYSNSPQVPAFADCRSSGGGYCCLSWVCSSTQINAGQSGVHQSDISGFERDFGEVEINNSDSRQITAGSNSKRHRGNSQTSNPLRRVE